MSEGPTIIQQASLPAAALLAQLQSSPEGLSAADAAGRLAAYGPNRIAQQAQTGVLQELYGRLKNPLNGLLLVLAGVSWATGDLRAAIVIFAMVVLSVGLAFLQEHRSGKAAEKLRAMVRTRATVLRRGSGWMEAGIEDLVPGDIVKLAAGDLIPADLRILSAKTLHVNQSALTGESLPVDKSDAAPEAAAQDPLALPNICYMGSSVISGAATGVILRTGRSTFFGGIADKITANPPQQTSFDRGIAGFTRLMIVFIAAMVPLVFLINGLTKGTWIEALLFALAVAVGLTPEMLPMIVTVNLAKGAMAMADKRAIVKRLSSIQNFGAMDVLCTDKTGTLTQDKVILQYHLDFEGEESDSVLEYAYLNSYHQSGLQNLMDEAILSHARRPEHEGRIAAFAKLDEIPFDFERRRMSVILKTPDGGLLMITKGAVEEVLAVCGRYRLGEETGRLDPHHLEDAKQEMAKLNAEGFRVIAIAYKELSAPLPVYDETAETDLTLLGYAAFLDPPKESARDAIAQLRAAGVAVKILTGDNDLVTRAVCRQVGVDADDILLGSAISAMSAAQLAEAVETHAVFAKLSPGQKSDVIDALRSRGHVVGFLGDGINDGPALKSADVGISVDTAVDIAKESADIILLEKSLTVLCEGAIEGRKVFGNIVKYIKMGASSNFGNMFSVLGASLFLPFLPMLPIQVLTNNLLYDFSQTAIPSDNVDPEYLTAPRRWDLSNLTRFILTIGPISSIFDYATFFVMLWAFKAWNAPGLFQAGWFVESIVTQTLIIHIIRTAKIPFFQSRASAQLSLATLAITLIGAFIPYTPLGRTLGFLPLPALYWPALIGLGLGYAVLTQIVKSWFVRRYGM